MIVTKQDVPAGTLLDDLIKVPSRAEDASFYSDWGDPREYTIGDIGVGECAGEVVSLVEFGLQASERIVFEAGRIYPAGREADALPFARIVERAYEQSVPLFASGYYHTPNLKFDKATGQGKPFHYYAYGAAVSEVLIPKGWKKRIPRGTLWVSSLRGPTSSRSKRSPALACRSRSIRASRDSCAKRSRPR